jgi:hypothetical protein
MLLPMLACLAVHKVRVDSEPPGATVKLGNRVMGSTPIVFRVRAAPHLRPEPRRHRLTVQLPGYRPVTVNIGREVRWWRPLVRPLRYAPWTCLVPPFAWADGACLPVRTERQFVMVKVHGPAGTWTPEEVP